MPVLEKTLQKLKTENPNEFSVLEEKVERYKTATVRKRWQKNFIAYAKECWNFKDFNDVHDGIIGTLTRSPRKKFLFLVPRGHFKTSCISKAFPLWKLIDNPNLRILIANAVWDKAREWLGSIKNVVASEKFMKVFGDIRDMDRWTRDYIGISTRTDRTLSEPSIDTAGLERSLTGKHYDLIIIDDLVDRTNITTPEQIKKVHEFYADAMSLLEPDGTIILVGTRWHYMDLYGWIIDERKEDYDITVRRVKEECFDQLGKKQERLILPKKFNDNILSNLKAEKGSALFYAQYYNDPVPEEYADFKPDWIDNNIWVNLPMRDPQGGYLKYHYYAAYDMAYSKKKHSDYTGVVCVAVNNLGHFYVLESYRRKMNATEAIEDMFKMQVRNKCHKIGIESIVYESVFKPQIEQYKREKGIHIEIEELKHGMASKDDRITALIPLAERGMLHLSQACRDLRVEMITFPKSRHRDILDATAYIMKMAVIPGYTYERELSFVETLFAEAKDEMMSRQYDRYATYN